MLIETTNKEHKELKEGVSEQTSESSTTRREGSGENAGSGLVVSYEDTFVNLKAKMVDECKQLEYELMEINVSIVLCSG